MMLDGRTLETRWWGPAPEAAPTLVLLHEGLGCVALWRDFPEALAAATGCGVFAYSRFGYGGSDAVVLPRPMSYMHDEAVSVLPRVLDAAGFELIIIETVGVGQAEVAIASLADSVVVLLAPGMGDAIQAAKAGILEVADVFVVNKADKPDAQQVVRDLRNMIALASRTEGDWKPPIVSTVAVKSEGIQELVSRLNQHWSWLSDSGELKHRRQARAREELTALAFAALRGRLAASRLDELAGQVADGTLDPFQAADELLDQ